MEDLSVVVPQEAEEAAETRYVHVKCKGFVLTKKGGPWVKGDMLVADEVTLHDGTKPRRGKIRAITCSVCDKMLRVSPLDLEVEGG